LEILELRQHWKFKKLEPNCDKIGNFRIVTKLEILRIGTKLEILRIGTKLEILRTKLEQNWKF
jgi:hypothetical protein